MGNGLDQAADVALRRVLTVTEAAFTERAQLRRALESRIVIEQAKGVLAERLRVPVGEAFALLRRAARDHGLRLHDLAGRVVVERETPVEIVAVVGRELGSPAGR